MVNEYLYSVLFHRITATDDGLIQPRINIDTALPIQAHLQYWGGKAQPG